MARTTSPPSRTRALYERNLRSYRAALRAAHERIEALLAEEGIRATVTSRVKSFESYLEKVARLRRAQGRPVVVRDLLGLRVVCSFLHETERVRDLLVERFPVVEIEHKGPLHSLAEFGYESVHVLTRLPPRPAITLLPGTRRLCEVQVRTILQDAWAQIEHELVYKSDDSLPRSAVRRKLAAVSATLTLADVIFQEIRDAQTELRQRGAQRRESVLQAAFDRGPAPLLATTPLEMTRLARPDPALRDPRSRDIESRIVEALWLHSAGRLEPAIRLYGRLLRLRLPNTAVRSMIYNHRGIARLALSQPKRALGDFDRALRVDRENFRAHYNRGLCYRALGQPERALRELRRAAGAHPIEASARYAMAQVLVDLGRRRQARAECERALALDPKLEGARELLGLLAREKGPKRRSPARSPRTHGR